ncbi:hypothetical protein B0H14DRAFT_2571614 [Mycena olivaceomarginata]|nr:hypothetical protein B0H14DRAFT_2571614 [Mycena olivaceomarginata]
MTSTAYRSPQNAAQANANDSNSFSQSADHCFAGYEFTPLRVSNCLTCCGATVLALWMLLHSSICPSNCPGHLSALTGGQVLWLSLFCFILWLLSGAAIIYKEYSKTPIAPDVYSFCSNKGLMIRGPENKNPESNQNRTKGTCQV